MHNVCIKCGKERVVIEKWDEEIQMEHRVSIMTHIKMSCPDIHCQEEVDQMLRLQKQKEMERKKERLAKDKAEEEVRQKRAEANHLKSVKHK